MKSRIFFSTLILLFSVTIIHAQPQHVKDYLKRYQQIAKDEMNRAGVPASIKMAQGMLESNYGRSTLATKANNHFGMKCGSAWKGGTHYIEDDDYDASGRLIKSCFRKYKNPEASYYAHSEFLKAKRYSYLFNYVDPTDYKGWARGLKRLGYATSPTYAEKLISIIEKFELYKLDGDVVRPPDLMADNNTNSSPSSSSSKKYKRNRDSKSYQRNNDVKMVFAFANETPADIAVAQRVSLKKILKYNERLKDPSKKLKKNDKVYIQKKKRGYRGRSQYHFVKSGETMYDISQQYGIRLDKLYSRNRLAGNTEPLPGEKIKLRGWKVKDYAIPRTTKQGKPKKDSEFLDFELEPADVKDVETEKGPEPAPTTTTTTTTTQPTQPTTTQPAPTTGTKQIPEFHVVQRGETLYGISRLYGMQVNELKRKNNILTDGISVGQKLKLR